MIRPALIEGCDSNFKALNNVRIQNQNDPKFRGKFEYHYVLTNS